MDEQYKVWLEINNLTDGLENQAAYLIGNGASHLFDSEQPDKTREGIELYRKMGRKCRLWTAFQNPTKMSASEFCESIRDALPAFEQNMKGLGKDSDWAENWIKTLAAWNEMEEGDFD